MNRGLALLVLLVAIVAALSLSWGDRGLAPQDILAALQGDPIAATILGTVRAPRVATALLVGACLGVAGAITQAVMRNPLAEPGLLGINSGASLAVALLVVGTEGAIGHLMPLAGFAGGALAAAAIYVLAWRGGTSSIRLILVGIGIGAATGALTSLLTVFGDIRDVQRALAWMAGSIYNADWTNLRWLAVWSLPALATTWWLARDLDLSAFDDDVSGALGLPLQAMRAMLIALCTVLAGASVAAAGPISFIGLLAPQLVRGLSTRHAIRLPAAALCGALLLAGADMIGRLVQLPAGLLTPLIGAPFIGLLLWRRRND
ncbi:FecCD family ABC transporter permease [Ancylobacter pratisalsi]|uniref:Iron ABC transporter permease n=1 Tax=Ancylobacter pratisalsi TaxID=1745854 RepID=A0A6P1YPT8_9HYPH|nr:iron ABC transporter permease [Ancylobacter pratisalsi]QIB34706.1 iron ABC transporter permease [Ancylobacter pratisalsi]